MGLGDRLRWLFWPTKRDDFQRELAEQFMVKPDTDAPRKKPTSNADRKLNQ